MVTMETSDEEFLFKDVIMFRSGTQRNDMGNVIRKPVSAVKAATFLTDEEGHLPLFDGHEQFAFPTEGDVQPGFVDNIEFFQNEDGARWTGDLHFLKENLNADQTHLLLTKEKRDVSIGFTFTPEPAEDDPAVAEDQTNIEVNHLAWEWFGRCSAPLCGLDKQPRQLAADSSSNTESKKQLSHEAITLTNDPTQPVAPVIPETPPVTPVVTPNSEPNTQIAVDNKRNCDETKHANDSLRTVLEARDGEIKKMKAAFDALTTENTALKETKTALDAQLKESNDRLAEYDKAEKEVVTKEIIKNSSYTAEELTELGLDSLKERLDILKKAIKKGYPVGKDSKEKPEYDPKAGVNQLQTLDQRNKEQTA